MIKHAFLLVSLMISKQKAFFFRIENISQIHHFREVIKLLLRDGCSVVIMTRDYQSSDYTEFGTKLTLIDARLSPIIFRYRAFVAVSQNMRPPFLGKAKYIMPYGYFAKGISIPRFRDGYNYFCSICPFMTDYLLKNLKIDIKILPIGYPKSDSYFLDEGIDIRKKIISEKSVLIAPSHEEESALLEHIGEYTEKLLAKNYSVYIKIHPVYSTSTTIYRKKIDSLINKGLGTYVKFVYPGDDELLAYKTWLTITDYSSIANEAMSVLNGVILVDSPRFYNEFLKKNYPLVDWAKVVAEPAINSCYMQASIISSPEQLDEAITFEKKNCKSSSRTQYSEKLLYNRGGASLAFGELLRKNHV